MVNEKEFAEVYLGHNGKMISWSKSTYREENPDNLVVFNSNVCTKNGKIWYGDIDVTKSKENLLMLANALDEEVYILRETDGRFENEESPRLESFAAKFTPQGEAIKGDLYKSFDI
jgi:hypothetical protein